MKSVYIAYLHILAFVGLSAQVEVIAKKWNRGQKKSKKAAAHIYIDNLLRKLEEEGCTSFSFPVFEQSDNDAE